MRILLGISGGFDSAVSAHKLMAEGHTVEAAVVVMHEYTDTESAALACTKLGLPLHIIDARESFDKTVKEDFVNQYKNGRTPNPCVICNREVKLKSLVEYASRHGFDKVATGHYARVISINENGELRYAVARARDEGKDQSYMLARLSQEQLSKLVLPLSDEIKSELRQRSDEEHLPLPQAKDSQEICFIPDNDHAAFIESRIGCAKEGSFIDEEGHILGKHKGIIHYTVGQRKGLGIALGKRIFVSRIDPLNNTVTLSENGRTDKELTLSSPVYSGASEPIEEPYTVCAQVKIRYKSPLVPARVTFAKSEIKIEFDEPVKGAAPGQTAVIYKDDVVLAAGFIV